ncbi:MAG: molybdopterin-dependent oxidoreductase [Deltaproteobacteria bacterium]|nr:molybdopterin-dependent oxidoreductase [Deltaproteobacteria bacterium]
MTRTHLRTCHLCEAMCGIVIETEGDRVVAVRGDDDDPFSRGHICPKAPALAELHADPDRVRGPLKRVGDDLVPVGWDEALDEIAHRLHGIQREHGRNTVAAYLGNPTVHNHGSALLAPMFVHALGTRSRYSATSVDQLPHQLASWAMFGHQLLLPVPDLDRARFFLVLGANPLASNGSLMTAPDVRGRLKALRERGGRLVVVDPRRTETARIADEHVFIRPGTDALLLLALAQVILHEPGLGPRLRALAPIVKHLDDLRAAVAEFTPERVAPVTGIPATTIRRLARELHAADAGVVYGRLGASTQAFGAICQWLVPALNVVTGNLDRPGGAMFTRPAVDVLGAAKLAGIGRGSLGRWRSRVRGLPEANGELPVATLAEDILTPGEGRLRALVVVAGNPVLSTPNGRQLERALGELDLLVSVDCYVNETSRHAHFILPPISPLARSQYDVALSLLAVRNVAKWSPPVFEAPPDGRDDWQILLGLARRLEALRPLTPKRLGKRLTLATWQRLGPDGMIDVLLRLGPYGQLRRLGRGGLSLARLRESPHGLDLGALEPALPDRLPKDRRWIDLAPADFVKDLSRVRALLDAPAPAEGALLLIGRRHLRSNNSWMHNAPKLAGGKPRCTLLVHPDDARRLGLADGGRARVTSRRGSVEPLVEVSDEVMPGVVSLPHGFGHHGPGVRLAVATRPEHAGVSMNDLTDEREVDALAGTAVLTGVPVEVAAVG